ncbi:MAG: TRAP transporter large permease [Candidatus Rokubacteria bacterium]|nr:TRAP transporter large permease [Candidatus Rokubacteria bacterium]
MASIFPCASFAAISGSSVATAATIGIIAIPEMERRGYYRPFIFGSLAAGGTLGILIPPSIPMIIYGVMTETSIGHLYMAGIVPGVVLALLFAVFVIGYAMLWPAAALGSLVSLILAALARTLTWRALRDAFHATIRTTSMVMLIIIFASMFSHVIALIGAPRALFDLVVDLGLPRWGLFAAIFAFLLVIAYALEELSVMIIILPILFPLVTKLGFDPIWFGIIMVVWLEIGLITPPVGLNLFVIQNLMPGTTAADVTRGTTPYVVLMIVLVILLFLFPELALWLPRHMTPH